MTTTQTWQTLKGVTIGDEIALAIKGNPKNGPREFATVVDTYTHTYETIAGRTLHRPYLVLSTGDKVRAFEATRWFVRKVTG